MTAPGPVAVALAVLALSACGARRMPLPTGAGTPVPDFTAAYDEATRECAGIETITASLGLSGRSGGTKLRGRIDAGVSSGGRIRLEGFPPVIYGSKPFFILAASGADATLFLPRDDRVLRGAPAEAIVEALAGVALGADDLRAVLGGCGLPAAPPTAAQSHAGEWLTLERGETTTYLRRVEGRWRVAAAARSAMTIQYGDFAAGRARTVAVRTGGGARDAATDITLRLSDVEVGVPLEDRAFRVEVPDSAGPLTLEELRRNGPLGEKR
jgi:hypothetical protein